MPAFIDCPIFHNHVFDEYWLRIIINLSTLLDSVLWYDACVQIANSMDVALLWERPCNRVDKYRFVYALIRLAYGCLEFFGCGFGCKIFSNVCLDDGNVPAIFFAFIRLLLRMRTLKLTSIFSIGLLHERQKAFVILNFPPIC
jgi:hypothetical protein